VATGGAVGRGRGKGEGGEGGGVIEVARKREARLVSREKGTR